MEADVADMDLEERLRSVGLLRDQAVPMVRALDDQPLPKGTKHSMVRAALMVAVPFLKGSVRELRGVPDELLVSGIDEAIGAAVTLVRAGAGAIADLVGGE